MYKSFDKVQVGEMLYYISPISQRIIGVRVIGISNVKTNLSLRLFKVIVNKTDVSKEITEEKLIQAHKDEGTNITKNILVNKEAKYQVISVKGFPSFLSTDEDTLKAFMEGKIKL